jgi:fluoroquinolone transport system permease protein
LSANRIEGLAVGKLSGLALMGVVVPFFAKGNERFFAGFLPSFWIAEAVLRPTLLSIAAFLAICVLWCGFLYPRFMSRARG